MATYEINFSEVGKQQNALTEQSAALKKVLDELKKVEETMLGAAQWTAGDKKDFTEKYTSFLTAGTNLQTAATSCAEALQKISDVYKSAEEN